MNKTVTDKIIRSPSGNIQYKKHIATDGDGGIKCTREYTYSETGILRKILTIYPDNDKVVDLMDADGIKSRSLIYNSDGKLDTVCYYDKKGNITRQNFYDSRGNLTESIVCFQPPCDKQIK